MRVGNGPDFDETGSMRDWDLWVDFFRIDADGLTHAHTDHLAPGVVVHDGQYILAGDDDADPAVAQVVSVRPDGVLLLRVLPGHSDAHRHLLASQPA